MRMDSRGVVRWVSMFAAVALAGPAGTEEIREAPPLRLELTLTDGSRVIGTPSIETVPVETPYARMDIPLAQITSITMGDDRETAIIELQNGDKLKGVITLKPIRLETVFGTVSVGIEHLRTLRVLPPGGALPEGEGPLAYGGVNWSPWRTLFAVEGDKLVSLPKARPGFNYGHSGNGRGPVLVSNVGTPDWKDYSMQVEFCMSGVNPEFNPHGLSLDYRGGSILFHVADARESFNERGGSGYAISFTAEGAWDLGCTYNKYCAVPTGFGHVTSDGERSLAKGQGLKLDAVAGNKFRIDVLGNRIQIWMDNEPIADVRDEKMGETIGGQTLDHGGVGFVWGYDSMGWIRNFSVRRI